MTTPEADAAKQLYKEAVVIDCLNVSNWESAAVFQSLYAGGVTAINATVATWENYRETLDNIAAWFRRLREYDDLLVQVKTVDELLQAKQSGKVGIIFGSQNASPIENRSRPTRAVSCARNAGHSVDLPRTESVGQWVLGTQRRRAE